MADTWRYRFYQVQNGLPGFTSEQHLFDLPLNQATFSTKLDDVGQLQGAIEMTDPGIQKVLLGQPSLDLLCDRTAVYVELNGDLVWGGLLQQAQYDSSTKQAQIVCQDWWGYFATERIISWNASYTNADQLLIAADLLNIAQGAASTSAASPTIGAGYVVGGNVGVTLGAQASGALTGSVTSGVLTSVAWAETAFKNIGTAIGDLGKASNGFDWTIDVAYDSNGNPSKVFNLWYPRAGRTYQTQQATGGQVVFDLGSASGQGYTWQAGAVPPGNVMFAAGSGTGNQSIASEAADPSMLQAGWPLLEQSVSYTDIISQAVLDKVALAHLNQSKWPVRLPQIVYNPGSDSNQPLGSFAIGDDARLIIPPDPFLLSGYDSQRGSYGEVWFRVVQTNVTVSDEGKSAMAVTFDLPPVIAGT